MISSNAIFACSDVAETLAYYKNVLGFESTWTWDDPPTFGSATSGGVTIMFSLQPELAKHVRGHQHGIKVDDADELYRRHTANKATVVSPIEDKPWGLREYILEDLNGYHLRFAGPLSSSATKSRPFPEGVTIERRSPTVDEYAEVGRAAFGYKEPLPGLSEPSWGGIVALAPGGMAVGVLRIVRDADEWFSIWHLAVTPEWQGQRIGSKMMEEAVELIREACPHAIIYLFTFKHGFYERLGFKLETVSMRRLGG